MYIIYGYGRTGKAVVNFCLQNNIKFLIYDDNSTLLQDDKITGKVIDFPPQNAENIDAIIFSPGISTKYNPSNQFVDFAKKYHIPMISDIELFMRFFPKKKYVAITGTNGKSTTVTLVYEIFRYAGYSVALSGNIGVSPFENAIDCDVCILEVSSFQLEITNGIEFDISAVLNITPDHLDRYSTLENYKKEKMRICELSKQSIVNIHIENSYQNVINFSISHENTGFYVKGDIILYQNKEICLFPQTLLLGEHNRENILCAFAVSYLFGVNLEKISGAISVFKGIEHRLELVLEKHGILFYNDSKATNLDSTYNALRAINGDIFLIAGGKLVEDITGIFEKEEFRNVKMIALIGSSAGMIAKELNHYNNQCENKKIKFFLCGTLEKAVYLLYEESKKYGKATVLLSPFCKSFDQFKNFEERGKEFKGYVNALV